MGKHILFLIHGIGVHGSDWAESADGPADTLRRLSARYAYFRDKPFDTKIEIVPIEYDGIFQKITDDWKNGAEELAGLEPDLRDWISENAKTAVLDWLAGAGARDQFWWTHAADVLMYRLVPAYRERVRTHVLDKMAPKIKQEFDANQRCRCSVLAHSMGTAVMHDCLHLLGTERWGDAANALNPRHWRFQSIFMVANTSRLLEQSGDHVPPAYASIVRPGEIEDPDSYCGAYWNFRHKMDPATWLLTFEPQGWPHSHSVEIQHYRSLHVHDLSHYLENPRVHIPILRIVNENAVTESEATAAADPLVFPQFGGSVEVIEKLRRFKDELEQFGQAQPDVRSVADWIETLVGFYEIIGRHL